MRSQSKPALERQNILHDFIFVLCPLEHSVWTTKRSLSLPCSALPCPDNSHNDHHPGAGPDTEQPHPRGSVRSTNSHDDRSNARKDADLDTSRYPQANQDQEPSERRLQLLRERDCGLSVFCPEARVHHVSTLLSKSNPSLTKKATWVASPSATHYT